MKVAYVAGPFRGPNAWAIECNIRMAESRSLDIWRTPGWCAICPHTNTRFFQGAAPDEVWLKGDIEILLRCDALVLCPHWYASSGTRAEVCAALAHDIPIYFNAEDLGNDLRADTERLEQMIRDVEKK